MEINYDRMKLFEVTNNMKIKDINKEFIINIEDNKRNSVSINKNKYENILYTSRLLKDLIFLSFMQTIVLGIIIFLMERFNLFYLVVTTFGNIIFITELAITFFFIFLFIDVITECILNYFNMKFLKESKSNTIHNYTLFIIFIESLLQTFIFIAVNTFLNSIGLFGVYIKNYSGKKVSIEFFYFMVFTAVFFVEYFTEGVKIISNKIKEKSNIN